jgi:alpha-L-fucosidase
MKYAPTKKSLNAHRVPSWFEDAKLGIFIHWGLFSIPGFAPRLAHPSDAFIDHYPLSAVMTPYTEWYDNATRVPESPSARHHAERWGGRPYGDFRAPFAEGLEQWDPREWARLFRRAGARYVVLVTKHHDGYCLWPSAVGNPKRADWCSPRDIVGELADAVRAEGLRFGVYYSGGIDWTFNPTPARTLIQFIGSMPGGEYPRYAEAQVRELIERYSPSVLWNDISWPAGLEPMLQLMADYYEAVPEGVINDRWMHRGLAMDLLTKKPVQKLADAWLSRRIRRDSEKGSAKGEAEKGFIPPPPAHYDFRTPEYTSFDEVSERKWEATRGMSPSFGFNREDREEHYEDPVALIRSFIDTVSKNGNLLLNVGPRGEDAAIPDPQRRRLELLGDWLAADGEAVYETRPCRQPEAETACGLPVRFTQKEGTIYAIVLGSPSPSPSPSTGAGAVELSFPLPAEVTAELSVSRLATGQEVPATRDGDGLHLRLGEPLPEAAAHAFALTPLA